MPKQHTTGLAHVLPLTEHWGQNRKVTVWLHDSACTMFLSITWCGTLTLFYLIPNYELSKNLNKNNRAMDFVLSWILIWSWGRSSKQDKFTVPAGFSPVGLKIHGYGLRVSSHSHVGLQERASQCASPLERLLMWQSGGNQAFCFLHFLCFPLNSISTGWRWLWGIPKHFVVASVCFCVCVSWQPWLRH